MDVPCNLYEPCRESRISAITNFPVGDWKIDESSLEFLRTKFKWMTLLRQCDHRFVIHNDGTALLRICLGAYGESGDIDYKCQLSAAMLSIDSMCDELIDVAMLSSNSHNACSASIQANAYRMRWKVVRREDMLLLKEEKYGDYFDRYYFDVDYPNQFEVGILFCKEQDNEQFFAVGEDQNGVYITPRVYRSRFKHELMELAVKFRRVSSVRGEGVGCAAQDSTEQNE